MTKHQSSCGCSDYYSEHDKKHSENKVVFSCGSGGGANIPVSSAVALGAESLGSAYQQPGLVVGTVTLNTRGLKSPSVKIDFSSVVSFKTTQFLFEIALRFQLSRACNNGPKIPLATWTYEREVDSQVPIELIGPLNVEFKDPIAFTWCDCDDCPGCCTYFVEIVDVDTEDIGFALVSNVGINALAIGKE